jgi:murein L,D-transpeptidase YafK
MMELWRHKEVAGAALLLALYPGAPSPPPSPAPMTFEVGTLLPKGEGGGGGEVCVNPEEDGQEGEVCAGPEEPPLRPVTPWRVTTALSEDQLAEVRAEKLVVVRELFAEADVAFPPEEMLLRAFKQDRRLELWAASREGEALSHVTTFEICAISGTLGPKRRQGDLQVPEGFYTLGDWEAPDKHFLSLLVSYPNPSDRILGQRGDPGGDIMIHGRCHSKGCLSMSDEGITEIFVAVSAFQKAGGTVALQVFPARDMGALIAGTTDPALRAFWENLGEGLAWFEREHRLPAVAVDGAGRYWFGG